jgi:hypothetical protein
VHETVSCAHFKVGRLLIGLFILIEWVDDNTLETLHIITIEFKKVGNDVKMFGRYFMVLHYGFDGIPQT